MNNPTNILVKDSCIIIDLIELDLMTHFLSLDYHIMTTTNVVQEITNPTQQLVLADHIANNRILQDQEYNLGDVVQIMNENRGLSFTDATALELSLRVDAIMLTSDNALRKIGIRSGQKTHGTLWAITAIYQNGLITRPQATDKIHELMLINKRITYNLCNNAIITLDSEKTTYNANK